MGKRGGVGWLGCGGEGGEEAYRRRSRLRFCGSRAGERDVSNCRYREERSENVAACEWRGQRERLALSDNVARPYTTIERR